MRESSNHSKENNMNDITLQPKEGTLMPQGVNIQVLSTPTEMRIAIYHTIKPDNDQFMYIHAEGVGTNTLNIHIHERLSSLEEVRETLETMITVTEDDIIEIDGKEPKELDEDTYL